MDMTSAASKRSSDSLYISGAAGEKDIIGVSIDILNSCFVIGSSRKM